jgi:hypothetical protein
MNDSLIYMTVLYDGINMLIAPYDITYSNFITSSKFEGDRIRYHWKDPEEIFEMIYNSWAYP